MRFWTRFIAWHGFAAVALVAACFLYLLAAGDYSWYVGVIGTVLVLGAGVGGAVYFVYRNRSLAAFRRMLEPTVTFDFSDAGISTTSDLGSGSLSSRAIAQVWTFPEAWLIFTAKSTYFIIPAESLTDNVRRFIRSKVLEHGGVVK